MHPSTSPYPAGFPPIPIPPTPSPPIPSPGSSSYSDSHKDVPPMIRYGIPSSVVYQRGRNLVRAPPPAVPRLLFRNLPMPLTPFLDSGGKGDHQTSNILMTILDGAGHLVSKPQTAILGFLGAILGVSKSTLFD